ncbi:unnamed protein product [Pelagomonas calceolata]|uniref:Pectinesterase inhibitor domain-containing protein n=1 Tax=Pelagomonas calceolata TaxID=35677 RepID=A0A8J2S6R1_9STRA|nr:unnamed protein product [Pelagomonas calceolata]
MMRFTALAWLATATYALTPSRKIKVARKNTLDSSVTFDEYCNSVLTTSYALDESSYRYQNIMDQCIVNSDSESAIEDCLKLTKQFEIVDVPPLDTKMAANRAQAQLETLASEKNPLAAPIHLEYYALLALVVILYVDILDVAGIVARFQH